MIKLNKATGAIWKLSHLHAQSSAEVCWGSWRHINTKCSKRSCSPTSMTKESVKVYNTCSLFSRLLFAALKQKT